MDERSVVPAPRATRAERPETDARRFAALRTLVAATAVLVLAATALGWAAENGFDNGFLRSAALGDDAPRSLDGDMNILLIGLDTRKDQDGRDLPAEILDQLHAGDGAEGGYNANTLILAHIPADMSEVTAFSIPRDDYVPATGIPGYTHVKIKETYGLKKASVQDQLIARGETDPVTLERAGREAGRASVIRAVRDLTGVPIDHFAEVTLGGFYELADALGGVEVCLRHPVRDPDFSGADFPAGRQRLDPAQSLAFVRQRHGLTDGDLDRTHRQQAFLTAVAMELRRTGTFTDVGKLSDLMDVAHRNVVLSDGWDVVDFLRAVGRAEPPVEFRTLPVVRYDVINGQDVNIVDPAAIRREVRAAFGESEDRPVRTVVPSTVVDLVATGARRSVATSIAGVLAEQGYGRGGVVVAESTADSRGSVVYHAPGGESEARQLAQTLGGLPTVEMAAVESGRVKVVLGADFTAPPALGVSSGTAAAVHPGGVASVPGLPTPDAGQPLDTDFGSGEVPCVN